MELDNSDYNNKVNGERKRTRKDFIQTNLLTAGGIISCGLLTAFGEGEKNGDIVSYSNLNDFDLEEIAIKSKEYSDIAYYCYKPTEMSEDDPIYIKNIPGYPLEEADYNLAAKYDKKVIDIYSLVTSGKIIDPGKEYGRLEDQIVSFVDHILQRFDEYIEEDIKEKALNIIKDLNGFEDIGKEKFNYSSITEEEREQYKVFISKMAKQTGYLAGDTIKDKTLSVYFPITEKWNLLVQVLTILIGDHASLANAFSLEGVLLSEKVKISLDKEENIARAKTAFEKAEAESNIIGRIRHGRKENNIGEVYFVAGRYMPALQWYSDGLVSKIIALDELSMNMSEIYMDLTDLYNILKNKIEKNKKIGQENDLISSKLDRYFFDDKNTEKNISSIIDTILSDMEKYVVIETEEFTMIAKNIIEQLELIGEIVKSLNEDAMYLDTNDLEAVKGYTTKIATILKKEGQIRNIDVPYLNIGKTKIILAKQDDDIISLKEGKNYLDIAESFQKFLDEDIAEVHYYKGEYYKNIKDFKNAQKYFLSVYNNDNADIKFKYKAVTGLKFTSFKWDDKFRREKEEIKIKEEYDNIYFSIQNSMNEYVAVIQIEKKNDKLRFENQQRLKEKEQEAEIMKQKLFFGGGLTITVIFGFIAWLISMRKKNNVITNQKDVLEEFKEIINQTDNAVLVKNINGEIIFENDLYKSLTQKDIVSTGGMSERMFNSCIETKKSISYTDLVIWNIDPNFLTEEQKKIERNSFSSKYIFINEGGEDVIREQRWYHITLTPYKGLDGKVSKVASMSTDITMSEIDRQVKQKQQIEIEIKNAQIKSSISYGKKIQNAMLPSKEQMNMLGEHFVFYKPKDIISGDFYRIKECNDNPNKVIVATVDCTGHGVPGAMMSMMGISNLDDIWNNNTTNKLSPAEILEELHRRIKLALQKSSGSSAQDGMDLSLYILDKSTGELQYSGAMNDLYIVDPIVELITLPATKRGINDIPREKKPFENHIVKLNKGTTIYSSSDGYQDQYGGPHSRKFMKKKYRELLKELHKHPIDNQKQILSGILDKRRGQETQMDDILVMGVKV